MSTYSGTSKVSDVLASVKISRVYAALTAKQPRPSGANRFRGQATWRGGDGLTVSLDDAKGVWHDPKANEGGGVLDLVRRVRGGDRRQSLRWLSEFAGVPLDDRPLSQADRSAWAREAAEYRRDMAAAHYWARTAITMIEDDLDREKGKLFETSGGEPDCDLIRQYELTLLRLRGGDMTLIAEYRRWYTQLPTLCAAMVRWARDREAAEVRALIVYFRQIDGEALAA